MRDKVSYLYLYAGTHFFSTVCARTLWQDIPAYPGEAWSSWVCLNGSPELVNFHLLHVDLLQVDVAQVSALLVMRNEPIGHGSITFNIKRRSLEIWSRIKAFHWVCKQRICSYCLLLCPTLPMVKRGTFYDRNQHLFLYRMLTSYLWSSNSGFYPYKVCAFPQSCTPASITVIKKDGAAEGGNLWLCMQPILVQSCCGPPSTTRNHSWEQSQK